MVMINRGSVQTNCTELLDLKQPIQQAQNFIQPTIEVGNRVTTIFKSTTKTTTAAGTLYTTPVDKSFYLTFLQLSFTKDAASDAVIYYADAVVDGAIIILAALPVQTLTATSQQVQINFPYPVKLDKNSAIRIGTSFTVGTTSYRLSIGGYILE